jgi:mRNA-degrading endonuclease YafQ of YafQ-DinJ toxin-antitoxin module
MVQIAFAPSFIRAYKKKVRNFPSLQELFAEKLVIFQTNPFDKILRTHKLSGKLDQLYSFSINFDIRIIFSFYGPDKVIFENIGSHDDVY